MLNSRNINHKTYEEYVNEAIARIQLYSNEWTNYNPSDPGITILENFSAFTVLQGTTMDEVPDEVKWKLLKLAGFVQCPGTAARVFAEPAAGNRWMHRQIPGEKLYSGSLCYEFISDTGMIHAKITAADSVVGGVVTERNELLSDRSGSNGIEIFGSHPSGGEEIIFYLDEFPMEDVCMYVETESLFPRNRFDQGESNPFVTIEWYVYTAEGFVPVEAADDTGGFLLSGLIRIKGQSLTVQPVVSEDKKKYVIKAKIATCAYDIPPRVRRIRGLLTQAVQRDTRSALVSAESDGQGTLIIEHTLLKDGSYELYRQTENGYAMVDVQEYEEIRMDPYTVRLTFKDTQEKSSYLAVVQAENILGYRYLGKLLGYDDQEISLPPWSFVYSREFSILVRRSDTDRFDLIHPEEKTEDGVFYTVDERQSKIVIHDCGSYEGCEIYLGNYSLYSGADGTVIPETELLLTEGGSRFEAKVCCILEAGRYEDTIEEVRRRFAADLAMPVTAVTRADFEKIILSIPGLSIHKIYADVVPEKNEVQIVIKPNSEERFPKLSDTYRKVVEKYILKRRLLTTKIKICQPRYVPVNVRVIINVKKYAVNVQKQVNEVLVQMLDGIHSERNFGEKLYIREIFQEVLTLECVDEIQDMYVFAKGAIAQKDTGVICFAFDELFYPGDIQIEMNLV